MRERAFADNVLRKLRETFVGHWRKNPVSQYGNAGIGDIIGCCEGRYVEVELKAPGKYTNPEEGLSPLQARHGQEIIANGGIYIVSDDWFALRDELGYTRANGLRRISKEAS